MKNLYIILIVLLVITSFAFGRVSKPDIVEARLNTITIQREGNSIIFYFTGKYIDENGNNINVTNDPNTFLRWKNIPQAWKDALLPVLKDMSKRFNKKHANEDVETLDITEVTTTTTSEEVTTTTQ